MIQIKKGRMYNRITNKNNVKRKEKMMGNHELIKEKEKKFSWKKGIGYALINGGNTLGALFVSYVTYFATDSLFLSAASIGMVLAFSRVFDGITDLLAGAIIDRTQTRWGKARPFILIGFLYWAAVVAMFSTPDISNTGKLIWIFITYNLNSAVFGTLVGTSVATLLRRMIVDENARIKTLTMSSLLVNIAAVVVSIALPTLIANTNNSPAGWRKLAIIFAVVGCVIDIIAFLCCREYTEEELAALGIIRKDDKQEKPTFKEYIQAITKNKYLLNYVAQYSLAMLAMGLFNGAGTYYFATNLGNLALMSMVSLVSLASYPLFLVYPKIIEKVGPITFTRICFLLGAAGNLARAFVGDNTILLCVTTFFCGFLLTGINLTGNEITIQCMDYSYLKNGIRAEAIYSALTGFTYKFWMGISSAVMGVILGIAHYNGALATQPASAKFAINFMYNLFPAIVGFILFFTFKTIRVIEENERLRAEMLKEENQ